MRVELLEQGVGLEFWDVLGPLIDAALSFDPYASITPEEVKQAIASGHTRVYIAHEEGELLMATATQIYRRRDGAKVLHVLATAGEKSHLWLPELQAKLSELAGIEGCSRITMTGRPGWARKLRRLGWNVSSIDMEWRVEDEQRREIETTQQPGVAQLPGTISGALPAEPARAGAGGSDS